MLDEDRKVVLPDRFEFPYRASIDGYRLARRGALFRHRIHEVIQEALRQHGRRFVKVLMLAWRAKHHRNQPNPIALRGRGYIESGLVEKTGLESVAPRIRTPQVIAVPQHSCALLKHSTTYLRP